MLIDGALVAASDRRRVPDDQPGHRRGARAWRPTPPPADLDRAIGAARRAFDESSWSTDVALRVRCLRQLQRR